MISGTTGFFRVRRCSSTESRLSLPSTIVPSARCQRVQARTCQLFEGRPLALAVVREHYDPVGARGQTRRRGDASELPVDPGENSNGVASLGPRVVGNLVVTEKRRVHDGAPREKVGDEDLDLDVT